MDKEDYERLKAKADLLMFLGNSIQSEEMLGVIDEKLTEILESIK